jgi:hypothetical protein
MGELIYGSARVAVAFDNRALAHLQAVIGSKLRRHESFFFTWTNGVEHGGGRDSIWVDGAIPLQFLYATNAREILNRDWIELLSKSANSAIGLQFLDEPVAPKPHTASGLPTSAHARTLDTAIDSTTTGQRVVVPPARQPVHPGR